MLNYKVNYKMTKVLYTNSDWSINRLLFAHICTLAKAACFIYLGWNTEIQPKMFYLIDNSLKCKRSLAPLTLLLRFGGGGGGAVHSEL